MNQISLITGTTLNRYSTSYESDKLVNANIVAAQSPGARSGAFMTPRLGKETVLDMTGIVTSFYSRSIKTVLFCTDDTLYYLNDDNEAVSLITGFNVVEMPLFEETWDQCVFYVDEKHFYAISSDRTYVEIPSTNLQGGDFTALTFIDGYVLASIRDSRQFIRSELNGTSFSDDINFSFLQSNDNIVNIQQLNRELYIFCDGHTEIWWNSGADPDKPFSRQDGRIFPIGVQSDNSIHLNGAIYNVCSTDDNTCGVYQWTSGGYTKISFDYLDKLVAESASTYVLGTIEDNKTFITVTINGAVQWTYCVDTKVWHQRIGWDATSTYGVNGQFYGTDYYGIFKIAGETDRGVNITCEKTSQVFHSSEKRQFFKELLIDVGGEYIGNVKLLISDDGGATWRNSQSSAKSVRGHYTRLRFLRLGSSRSRVFKLLWENANIYDAYLDGMEGSK